MGIIIRDAAAIKEKRASLSRDKVHVLADFDKTLTRAFYNGAQYQSTIALVRDGEYLSPEYVQMSKALFAKYHPLEIDNTLTLEERSRAMEQWWAQHWELMIASGLNRGIIEDIVKKGVIRARDGLAELIDDLEQRKIPILILSAGLGNIIEEYMSRAGLLRSNVEILSNFFYFDESGRATGYSRPLIHSFNKSETQLPSHHFAGRDQVILLGDSLGDLGMSARANHALELSVGFANYRQHESDFIGAFDAVVTDDGSLEFVRDLIRGL